MADNPPFTAWGNQSLAVCALGAMLLRGTGLSVQDGKETCPEWFELLELLQASP